MNAPERIDLPDVQSQADRRNIAIDAVGIKGVRYPITVRTGVRLLPAIATLSMTVALAAATKGTHMSRFIELLEQQTDPIDARGFRRMVFLMIERLGAAAGAIEMRFRYFVRKRAPVSGAESWLDYDVCWRGTVAENGAYSLRATVVVPVTSLCPC
jgi:GTP cyclohydrolase FolE2